MIDGEPKRRVEGGNDKIDLFAAIYASQRFAHSLFVTRSIETRRPEIFHVEVHRRAHMRSRA